MFQVEISASINKLSAVVSALHSGSFGKHRAWSSEGVAVEEEVV